MDVASFWEIAPGVVVKPEDQGLDRVATHLSSQRGYPIHALPQDWMPGIGTTRALAPAWVGPAAEGLVGSLEGTP